jgi:uncharacterized lipoprotein YajG
MRSSSVCTPLLLVLLVLLSIGCVTTDPLPVDFSTVSTNAQAPVEGCVITVSPVADARRSKDDLGTLGPRVVEGQDVMPWIERSVQTLSSPVVETASRQGDVSGLKHVDVQVALNQLYVHSLLSSFGGNIHLNVQYRLNQGPPESYRYRGSDTSVNWFGTAESVSDLLNDVLEDLLEKMRSDIVQLCRAGR